MLDILRQYLAENASPEGLAMVEQAHATFERVGLENYEPAFEELLMLHGSEAAGNTDTLAAIVDQSNRLLRQVLQDHAVVVVDHCMTPMLTDLVNALLDLDNYGDLATLYYTATLEGPATQVFADLVALVSEHTAVEVMANLEEVSFFLIKRIRELAQRQPTPEETAQQQVRVAAHRARIEQAIAAGAISKQLTVLDAVRDGVPMGLPFATYIRQFGWNLQQWLVDRAGQELLAMALISKDGQGNPAGMIQEYIEQYVPGLERVTQIDVDITDRLLKINHEQA